MRFRLWVVASALAAAIACPAFAQQSERIVVDGNDWMRASSHERRIFMIGVANMIVAESAYAKRNGRDVPPVADRMTKSLGNLKLPEIESRITRWYEANPDRRTEPVMAVVWRNLVQQKP